LLRVEVVSFLLDTAEIIHESVLAWVRTLSKVDLVLNYVPVVVTSLRVTLIKLTATTINTTTLLSAAFDELTRIRCTEVKKTVQMTATSLSRAVVFAWNGCDTTASI